MRFFLTNREGAKNTKKERRREEEKKRIEIIHNLCENCFVNFPNALFAQCPVCPMPKK
jgi:hypothetical protein